MAVRDTVKRKDKTRKISTQFLMILIPAIALLFVAFGLVVYYLSKPEALKTNHELAEIVAKKTNQALIRWLEEQIRTAQIIARDPRIIDVCLAPADPQKRAEAQKYLSDMHALHPYYENIPLALKMADGRTISFDVQGEKRTIGNGNFFLDTVQGKTIGKCGPEFSYIKNVFAGKPYFISEVYPSILRGNPIFVVAVPVLQNGEILGATIVAPRMDYFTEFFVEKSVIGQTGYLVMVDSSGMIISHPQKTLILNPKGRDLIRPVMARIESGDTYFLSRFEGAQKAYYVEKLTTARFNMQDSWYIIFCRGYDDILAGIHAFLIKTLVSMLLVAVAVTLLVYLLSRSLITLPMKKVTWAVRSVTRGDLRARIDTADNLNEVGVLSRSINNMTQSIREQTIRIREAVEILNGLAASIVSASSQQEEAMLGFEGNVAQVGASAQQISATSQDLAKTMDGVKNAAREAARLANAGQTSLASLQDAMGKLSKGTGGISEKLTTIHSKAKSIDIIIETITKISDQTNLLSLNAAIEAEKAGEYGRGFSVVAREIGRLANETAISTLDISEIINEMQASVADGVKEMEHFRDGVAHGVSSADDATLQLSQVIAKVANLGPEFDKVNDGMHFQSLGSRQISEAMADLNSSAGRMSGSLSQFKAAADQLSDAANRLIETVSRAVV
ncbi:MAG: methyl-accepting chemotaxis protein [Smithellaceae bacterium]|nr:methyl-accepting chemotaxis protein [Syntrophaceae bacterium]MDD4240129.1 methyl-accepting chemotaxis protein [Smithellaceae bacterium]NLX51893.1 methyl-accepting chemotaxis protein [Deltaproteobacteria bacterium]